MKHQKFLAPLAFALGLAAAGSATAETLTMGVRGGPESMDPHFSALGPHAEAAKHIFDTLVWSGTDLQIEPGLATSWSPVDDDTWEFKLREGVKFHDGSDFDAEDVKFSIERIPVVSGPTTTTIYVRRVAGVDIIDPHTIHIHTDGQALDVLGPILRRSGLTHNNLTIEKQKMSTLFLVYDQKNQLALNRLVEAFSSNAQALGVKVKLADFKDL